MRTHSGPHEQAASTALRLFYALWPDDATRERLAALQSHIHGKLTRYENLHVTLAFLGEQPAGLLAVLRGLLDRLPRGEVVLTLDRLGYFRRKRIAWAGPHAIPDALHELVHGLRQELIRQNVAFDRHTDFKPHVTLARNADAPSDFAFDPIVWHANRIVLVQSTTQADGVRYKIIAGQEARTRAAPPSI